MIDVSTRRGRIIAAALRLAAERAWESITLVEIAAAAELTLADLPGELGSKAEIVAAFATAVDAEMLRRAARPAPGQSRRDALFEVVMSRLDALAPYKPALRSIARAGRYDPAHLRPFLAAQGWMLQAAGIATEGVGGAVRVAGLAGVYAAVLDTWLGDDDPGMARTMAMLDLRLRRGEAVLSGLSAACSSVNRLCEALRAGFARAAPPAAGTATPDPSAPPAAP